MTDGSSIQVTIYYSITDSDIVTAENNIIYYQLPNGIRLTEEENGPVEVGDEIAGTYIITTDGLITITFNESFADGSPFSGNISFHGEVSLADIEGGDGIVFGGAGGTITIVPDAGDTSLHIEKTGDYNKLKENTLHRYREQRRWQRRHYPLYGQVFDSNRRHRLRGREHSGPGFRWTGS